MSGSEWYREGLAFECTQCGACCTGPEGYVLVSDDEADRMARAMKLKPAVFRERYLRKLSIGWSLNEKGTEHGQDCVFLDRETLPGKAVCGIYEHRPLQCRTFPWWPENLQSQRAWKRLGRGCEGVGRGGIVRIEEIRIERDRMIEAGQGEAARAP